MTELSRNAAGRASVVNGGCPRPLVPVSGATSASPRRTGGLAQSKAWRGILALGLLTVVFGFPASAQYAIDLHTIDGGGSTSTGGIYSVSGTIGQPDAGGPLTNGLYSITGGFWALPVAVQTLDAPLLTIVPFGSGEARISWTPTTPGFVLQETLSLSNTNWVNSASGTSNPITVPATIPTRFYRLRKP